MKPIEQFIIWKDGVNRRAAQLGVGLVYDNLKDEAEFSFKILTKDYDSMENKFIEDIISIGTVVISGYEYDNWGRSEDINEEVYKIVAQKLNIQLI